MFCFSLAAFRSLYLSFTFAILKKNMSWCRSVWVCHVRNPVCLMCLDICFLFYVWEDFRLQVHFQHFLSFLSFWDPCYAHLNLLYIIPKITCIVFFIFFFFFFFFPVHLAVCLLSWLGDFPHSIFEVTYLFLHVIHSAIHCLYSGLIMAMEFSNFSWFLLILSSSFLQ